MISEPYEGLNEVELGRGAVIEGFNEAADLL